MKTKNQKGGAIFTLLAGLIASAIAGAASQAGGGVQKRKKGAKETSSLKV
jgi:Flp pilus assembly pilin Flp